MWHRPGRRTEREKEKETNPAEIWDPALAGRHDNLNSFLEEVHRFSISQLQFYAPDRLLALGVQKFGAEWLLQPTPTFINLVVSTAHIKAFNPGIPIWQLRASPDLLALSAGELRKIMVHVNDTWDVQMKEPCLISQRVNGVTCFANDSVGVYYCGDSENEIYAVKKVNSIPREGVFTLKGNKGNITAIDVSPEMLVFSRNSRASIVKDTRPHEVCNLPNNAIYLKCWNQDLICGCPNVLSFIDTERKAVIKSLQFHQ